MNSLVPIITEKTTKLASTGKYTFKVDPGMDKFKAKELVEKLFGVTVVGISSVTKRSVTKKTGRGRKKIIAKSKKIIVKLSGKDKIDLFSEDKKK